MTDDWARYRAGGSRVPRIPARSLYRHLRSSQDLQGDKVRITLDTMEERPTVLIVDDDPGVHQMLTDVLSDEGYDVVAALNGREGLDRLHERKPDVILLDLMMPVMDGWRFREEMRRIEGAGTIPVVVLSATHSIVDAAKQIQADGYIAKPFDLDQLLAKLADYAGQKRNVI